MKTAKPKGRPANEQELAKRIVSELIRRAFALGFVFSLGFAIGLFVLSLAVGSLMFCAALIFGFSLF